MCGFCKKKKKKNLRIESYNEKYLSGRHCGDRADGRVDMGRTNSQVSRRYDELITKQAAKTKEQAATAKKTNARAWHSEVAYVLGQHFTRDLYVNMKRTCMIAMRAGTRTLNATHTGYNARE